MGIFKMSGGSPRFSGKPGFSRGSNYPLPATKRNPIEPDPFNFKIVRGHEKNGHSLIEVKYPNCTNFDGSKLLLIAAPLSSIQALSELDPHFLEEGSKVPILARFRPTNEGWDMGLRMLDVVKPFS